MLLPAPTPAATLATAAGYAIPPATTIFATAVLELRQDLSSQVDYDISCANYVEALSCDSAYVSCLESVDSQYIYGTGTSFDVVAEESAFSKCYCTYGVEYLSCYYNALTMPACKDFYGINDWTSYESYWFEDNCGTVPANVLGGGGAGKVTTTNRGKPPTVVSLDLEPVTIVTLSSTPPPPTYTYEPLYQSEGNLLNDECASTQFTLIEDVNTVYWAAYIGCASNMPQCCPWTAASEFIAATLPAGTTVTVTSTVTPAGTNVALNAFPVAANANQGVLKQCASDYYSISGACCPSNYWPFTRDLGGQTPCYSSLDQITAAPDVTAGLAGEPTASFKPTSAVVNVVWAMSYPVQSNSGLSKGAIAGIAVGAVVAVAAIAALSFFLIRSRRKTKQLQQQQQQPQVPQLQQQPQVVPVVAQGVPVQDVQKQQGMVQVQPAAAGYVYPQQPVPQHPQQQPGFAPVVAAYDGRGSIVTASTPVSALVPQSTGTTVSELSGNSGSVGSGAGLLSASPHPVSTGSPGSVPVYPAPIAEADESAYHQQQQPHYQQVYYQQQQQAYSVPAQAAPGQFYQQVPPGGASVPVQPGYAPQPQGYAVYPQQQPQAQYAPVYAQPQQAPALEIADGHPVPAGPAEVAAPANVPDNAAQHPEPTPSQGHPPA